MTIRNHSPDGRDAGFTLIELLVVVMIIGILAAIAIPVFLQQRVKAYDTSVKSDLRNLAQFEEGYLEENNTYATIADIKAAGDGVLVSPQVTLGVVVYDGATGFCLSAKHYGSPNTYYYDSLAGGIQVKGTAGCPTMTSGTGGDVITG